MTTSPMIRDITDEDVATVIALWHAAGIARPWNDPAKDIAFARRDDHSTILVAEIAGEIAATVMVGEDGHRGWVYYVAAAPQHQGLGLGRAVMAAAEAWLITRGVWKLNLLVRQENAGVRQFYERLGYGETHSICFQKTLQPDAS